MYDYIITKPPLDDDTLTHFGVKGMKWGVRKDKDKPVSARKQKRIDKKNKIKQYKAEIKKYKFGQKKNFGYYNYATSVGGYKSAAKIKYDIEDRKMNPIAAYAKRFGIDYAKIMAASVGMLAAYGAYHFLGPGAGQYAKGNRMLAMGMVRNGVDKVLDNVKKKRGRKSIKRLVQKADVIIDGPFRVLS